MEHALIKKYGTCNTVANCGKAHGVPDWVAFCIADVYLHEVRKTDTERRAFDHMRTIALPLRQSFYGELQELVELFR
jgi:hypothetical protein